MLRNGIVLERVTKTYYEAGHMMYLHEPDLVKLSADIRKFLSEYLGFWSPQAVGDRTRYMGISDLSAVKRRPLHNAGGVYSQRKMVLKIERL